MAQPRNPMPAQPQQPSNLGPNWIGTRRLGIGSFGQVWIARNVHTGQIAAVKAIALTTEDEDHTWLAARECAILQNLDHPCILKLFGLEIADGVLFMVCEHAQLDLYQWLHERSVGLNTQRVQVVMTQLMSGLAYLHSHGVIHRDIKPENILVFSGDVFKLGDFGLARITSRVLRAYSPDIGTMWYRAPELLLDCPTHTSAVDVWALGCVFMELYTLQALFSGDTAIEQYRQIVQALGPPTPREWQSLCPGEHVRPMQEPEQDNQKLLHKLAASQFNAAALDLFKRMIVYTPGDRITAKQALDHPYLKESVDRWRAKIERV